MLRVELATFSGHFAWTGEYGNFKITKKGEVYSYEASEYRTNFCLRDAFAEGIKNFSPVIFFFSFFFLSRSFLLIVTCYL